MATLADIFRQHGFEYLSRYSDHILFSHKRVVKDIMQCRTSNLGGQVYRCDHCDDLHYSYHSCKNRHCPQCMNDSADEWLEKQKDRLLPVLYFMATFTLPDTLRQLARSNQKVIYNLFFKASSDALKLLASDPHYIGGTLGLCGVLHTWTKQLHYHPHIHYLIPGGGLKGMRWKMVKKDYLMPVKALSKIFRAKFRDGLKKTDLYDQVPSNIWRNKWVVHIEPVGSGLPAFKYLAPYIFRVAISNNNILSLNKGKVTFRFKDSNTKRIKFVTIPANEFIRRFLQHVLPHRFRKVRYYGFLSPRNNKQLEQIRKQLKKKPFPHKPRKTKELFNRVSILCPKCGQKLIPLEILPRKRGPPWQSL